MANPKEQHRILLIIPLLILLATLFLYPKQPKVERAFLQVADQSVPQHRSGGSPSNNRSYPSSSSFASTDKTQSLPQATLFAFDPNSVTHAQLVQLGFTPRQAQGIINYRTAGKVFVVPEDFAKSYVVTPEKFEQLRPYIHIGTQAQSAQPSSQITLTESRSATDPVTTTTRVGTAHEAAGTTPAASVPPSATSTTPALLELNSADSIQLVAVRGIGALTAERIIHYRRLLGGFASPTQLQEIAGMNEKNYLLILTQIWVDTAVIQKIDINFALPQAMRNHPYLPSKTLNKVLKNRQLEGGWSNTTELIKHNILSAEEAERLAPYLIFRAKVPKSN